MSIDIHIISLLTPGNADVHSTIMRAIFYKSILEIHLEKGQLFENLLKHKVFAKNEIAKSCLVNRGFMNL